MKAGYEAGAELRCGQRLLSDIKLVTKAPGSGSGGRELVGVGLSQPFHDLSDSGELFTSHVLGMAMTELMEVQTVRDINEGKNTLQGFGIIARAVRQVTNHSHF